LDLERVDYWMGVGAQPSERVAQLIKMARKQAAA
jgi:small subunit ribosomal protein S16